VVAADTTVVHENEILGKPDNPGEAVEILQRLRGRRHQVFTGLAVLRRDDGNLLTDICVTDVFMRDYRAAEIEAYVATGDPLDKAGAYAIQHVGFDPVERIQGCYANVVGLPLCALTRLLRQLDEEPPVDITEQCRPATDNWCALSDQLSGSSLPLPKVG
jgi:MAF protein